MLKRRAKRKKETETIEDKRQRLQGRRTPEEDKDYYKQFPCKKFRLGKCAYGDECKYSHDVNLYIRKSRIPRSDDDCSAVNIGESS